MERATNAQPTSPASQASERADAQRHIFYMALANPMATDGDAQRLLAAYGLQLSATKRHTAIRLARGLRGGSYRPASKRGYKRLLA